MRGAAILLAALAAPAAAETHGPSGMAATLYEVHVESMHDRRTRAHFRFHMPELSGRGYMDVAGDFPWLCEQVVLPELDRTGQEAAVLVVAVADRPVPFGASDPHAVQFFEAFRRDGARCDWDEIVE